MTRAEWTKKDGTKVVVEGMPDEVANVLRLLNDETPSRTTISSKEQQKHARKRPASPVGLVSDLADAGFFKKPKELGVVKTALEEQGHFYPVTTLSPTLLRLVRQRKLRRIREGKRWLYVN
jgi:hypothetical protein